MNENEKIAEEIRKENQKRETEKVAPPPVSSGPVKAAKFVWVAGTIMLDVVTAYYIWQTTIMFYGVLWVLIGAGGLIYSEAQRERIGNNKTQDAIGSLGVNVSAGSVLVMAIIMGIVYLTGMTNLQWVMILTEVATVSLFAYHLAQSYRYHIHDDEFVEQNEDARLDAQAERDIRQAHRAARRVEAKKSKGAIEDEYIKQHGPAFNAAYQSVTHTPALTDENKPADPTEAGKRQ